MTDAGALLKERGGKHGDFTLGAEFTQDVMAELMQEPNWTRLAAFHREGIHMIVHKLQRVMVGQHDYDDHWLDIEGYARCVRVRLDLFDTRDLQKTRPGRTNDIRISMVQIMTRQVNYDLMAQMHVDAAQRILMGVVSYVTGYDLTEHCWLVMEEQARRVFEDIRSRS